MSPKTLVCLLGYLLLGQAASAQSAGNDYPLIPYPTLLVPARGSFAITAATRLVVPAGAKAFGPEAQQLQSLLAHGLGQPLKQTTLAAANSIALV